MPAPKFRWFVTVLIAMVILGVAAGLALSRARDSAAGALGPADPSHLVAPSDGPVLAGPSGEPVAASMAAYSGAPRSEKSVMSPATGPIIAAFGVTQHPSCPTGKPVVLSWRVTGAERTTLSVDGPGVYDTYGAEASATINFPCDDQAHTYTLAVAGPEGTESKTLTVTAGAGDPATT
ncbi:hypothetical protein [Actinoplanes couchii]|uniref:Secreted protein n=1 Tax=Actinoplanes couchii TaxID=403638 RepID=A0ABQ3XH20_9ACTN|nr:hypothetical protein [Actinoplanes couchii]MDR6320731.1 hypothetical protein [Actinoplanes couchii]GID57784.1 hypothetical protein Aco03nite_061880 [Actinoplanes couchii]